MLRRTFSLTFACCLALASGQLACTSSHHDTHLMSIAANDSELRLNLGEELARELLEGALGTELHCDTDLEPEFESMLRALDRKGRGARYRMATDGADVIATRRGSKLRIEVDGEDGWQLSATAPPQIMRPGLPQYSIPFPLQDL